MDVYKTEEEQLEAIKRWWNEYGKVIVGGVVIGLSSIFGWRAWDSHLTLQAETASTLYEQMLTAAQGEDAENARVHADQIIAEYKTTTYALFAGLMLAKLAAEENDLDEAETQLRWILAQKPEAEIDHIARLRLARILVANDKLDDALDTLNKIESGTTAHHYEELRGDIYLKQGKTDDAKAAYENALLDTVATEEVQSIIRMKLDDLGGA